jgi:hypothetical protein
MSVLAAPRLQRALATALVAAGLLAAPPGSQAARDASAGASVLSALTVAIVAVAPAALLTSGAQLGVVAVEAASDGTLWVLQRASDGAQASLKLAGQGAGGASMAVGTVVTVTALGTGLLLSAAGQAIAFIPNAAGAALLHNEQVSR